MDNLKRQLKVTFATAFSLYLKASNYHWNVEGPAFYQYHKLFQDVYTDVYESIDTFAEHIRAIGTYTPGSIKRIQELSVIDDALEPIDASEMIDQLLADNQLMIEQIILSLELCKDVPQQGIANFLADRLDQHNKWNWFLRSSRSSLK